MIGSLIAAAAVALVFGAVLWAAATEQIGDDR